MKTLIHNILNWLAFIIAAVVLLVLAVLALLHFANPMLERHRSELESYLSEMMQQPVHVESITVGHRGFEPLLKFNNVVIQNDAKTAILFQVSELEVDFDLIGSLISWHPEPAMLLVKGATLSLYEPKKGGAINVYGLISALPVSEETPASFHDMMEWLLTQGKIDLSEISFIWHGADGSTLKVDNFHFGLTNGMLQHFIVASGNVNQDGTVPAAFATNLNLHGDILSGNLESVSGDIKINDLIVNLSEKSSDLVSFIPKQGNLRITCDHSQLNYAGLFRAPLKLDDTSGTLSWRNNEDGLRVAASKLEVHSQELKVDGSLEIMLAKGSSTPTIDSQFSFAGENITNTKDYFPTKIMDKDLVDWLDNAFIGKNTIAGTMVVAGPLKQFPFDHNEGEFKIDSHLSGINLNYNSSWPNLTDMNADLTFEGRSMHIKVNSAAIMSMPTQTITADILDLSKPILTVDGVVQTDADNGLRFVYLSPLRESVAHDLSGIKLSGPMLLQLKLRLPLSDQESQIISNQVIGDIDFLGNSLQLVPWGVDLSNLQGKVHFTDKGVSAKQLIGKLFGYPVTVKVDKLVDDSQSVTTRVLLNGKIDVNSFKDIFGIDVAPAVKGTTDYRIEANLHRNFLIYDELRFESNLKGLSVDLPEPLGKVTSESKPLSVRCYFGTDAPSKAIITYNHDLNAALAFSKQPDQSLQLFGGEIVFGAGKAMFQNTPGLILSGEFGKVNLANWQNYFSGKSKENRFGDKLKFLRRIDFKFAELQAFGHVFHSLRVRASRIVHDWNLVLNEPQFQGHIIIPHDYPHGTAQAFFQKLYFVSSKQHLATIKPTDIPAIHLEINDFHYNGIPFGKVDFISTPIANGVAVQKLNFGTNNYNLSATGNWLMLGNGQQSNLKGSIFSQDIGQLLRQWGLAGSMAGGRGGVDFSLSWPGPVYDPSLSSVKGACSIKIFNGNIINLSKQTEAEIGFGKVLNLLSLQSLPRVLILDFSSVLGKGFNFDILEGDVELRSGNAYTHNVNLDGTVAQVKVRGRIGLAAKDYDIQLATSAHVTSSLPVIATIAGGPIAGALTWAASSLVSHQAARSAKYTYQISGSWSHPNIQKI